MPVKDFFLQYTESFQTFLDLPSSWLGKYFINPIYADSGYNLVNSITYALIALFLVYVIAIAVKRMKVKIDFNFFLGVLPFIILGSSFRAFVDHGFYNIGFWTISPGIYLLIASLFLITFFGSWKIEQIHGMPFWKTMIVVGSIILLINWLLVFSLIDFDSGKYFLAIIGLIALSTSVLYFVFKKLKWKWSLSKLAFLPFVAHMTDASATFIIADFLGGWEKHPVTRFANEAAGTAVILYVLKLIVLLPAVYFIMRDVKDKQLRNFLLIAIAVLGFAEGIRNIISMIL